MKQIAIVVDMQYDFLLGGKLYVWNSEHIFKAIYDICDRSDVVIATRDWHPANHSSFVENGGTWPKHCVAGEWGAKIYKGIDIRADVIFSKGMDKEKSGYSVFENKSFLPFLRSICNHADKIVVCGVAADYCVRSTAQDIYFHNFDNVVIPEKATAWVTKDELEKAKLINQIEINGVVYERL